MRTRNWLCGVLLALGATSLSLTGCSKPQNAGTPTGGNAGTTQSGTTNPGTKSSDAAGTTAAAGDSGSGAASKPSLQATASQKDVDEARKRLKEIGERSEFSPKEGPLLKEIVIRDGSNVRPEELELFGKLTDLEKFQLYDCRKLNDEMAAHLSGLKKLKNLALTNSAIHDDTVTMIARSFPDLVELDLSSNTNMTNGAMKIVAELGKLQRLTLIQNRFNDIGAQRLTKLQDLRALDLRGNMEAGDMALEVVAGLPKLTSLKHRSTAVTDSGMEHLARSQTIESMLLQDFVITDQSGPHLAKLPKLTQLEVFRCQGFGSEGVLALKGMGLTRLTLRDLPNVYDQAMDVFDDLPKLRRLYLHELSSVSDSGLSHLANLKSLELLDIWSVSQMTDATVDVIATLPNLKELSIRETGITDSAVDKIVAMPKLESLTLKGNASITAEGVKKLSGKKWTKLDLGEFGSSDFNTDTSP